jgi:hypothetical protein
MMKSASKWLCQRILTASKGKQYGQAGKMAVFKQKRRAQVQPARPEKEAKQSGMFWQCLHSKCYAYTGILHVFAGLVRRFYSGKGDGTAQGALPCIS